jgi:probable HAF family extracellular repeat protein
MNFHTCLSRFAFVLLFATATVCSAQTYTITDLGLLSGGTESGARAINASGEVTGFANSGGQFANVISYSNGVITNLGTLGGTTGIGNAINASGNVAGYSTNAAGTYRAFVSSDDALIDIGDLGGGSAVAYGINDSGQVVGSAVTSDGSNHPFLYTEGKMLDLGTLGSPVGGNFWNSAQGINKLGVIAGTSYNAAGNFLGFVWKAGKMTALGALGGDWSDAYAINNRNQITGIAYTKQNLQAHAFLLTGKTMKDLGTINGQYSWGFAINDSGVVVGQATTNSGYLAFVYSSGKMKDLNKLIPTGTGWQLEDAYGINNAGQIVGEGMLKGQEHGFLLTPQ